jgi:hypothetical protein
MIGIQSADDLILGAEALEPLPILQQASGVVPLQEGAFLLDSPRSLVSRRKVRLEPEPPAQSLHGFIDSATRDESNAR